MSQSQYSTSKVLDGVRSLTSPSLRIGLVQHTGVGLGIYEDWKPVTKKEEGITRQQDSGKKRKELKVKVKQGKKVRQGSR